MVALGPGEGRGGGDSVPDPGSFHEVGEREAFEELAHLLRNAHPHLLEDAVTLAVVVLVNRGGEGTVDRAQDLGQGDLGRRPSQHVAAAHPPF